MTIPTISKFWYHTNPLGQFQQFIKEFIYLIIPSFLAESMLREELLNHSACIIHKFFSVKSFYYFSSPPECLCQQLSAFKLVKCFESISTLLVSISLYSASVLHLIFFFMPQIPFFMLWLEEKMDYSPGLEVELPSPPASGNVTKLYIPQDRSCPPLPRLLLQKLSWLRSQCHPSALYL